MTTYGDFFTGFGGATIGAMAAGLDVLFGVEYDPDLAAVYRANLGEHIIVADVTTLNVAALPAVDVFHASPPCTSASVANANGGESPDDMAMATAVCRYIIAKRPSVFTLENVYQYRTFESWHMIARTLLTEGYTYNYWHVNMADYGVPQTRKRMIVVARRDGRLCQLPEKTHARNPRPGLFVTRARRVSWYEAIEDLIPGLPDSQFADWQLRKMAGVGADLPGGFLMEGTMGTGDFGTPIRDNELPSMTVKAANHKGMPRAFVPHTQANEPATTLAAQKNPNKILLANGRIVQLTPRALARLQSFPDWYELPKRVSLAVRGIGNAVPPLFAEKLYVDIVSHS